MTGGGGGVGRRQTRERREYLYRKSLEEKERQIYDKKKRIKEALAGAPQPHVRLSRSGAVPDHALWGRGFAAGKPIPTELRADEQVLRREIELDAGDVGTCPSTAAKALAPASDGSHSAQYPCGRRVRTGRDRRPQDPDHHLARPELAARPVCQGRLVRGAPSPSFPRATLSRCTL
jgi:hypothetical protein